jgi:hypothetical protein
VILNSREDTMRRFRFSICVVFGLVVALILIPSGQALAQGDLLASFTYLPAVPVAGGVVDFTDTSSGNPIVWNWYFGDGGGSTEQNPSHHYPGAGVFRVQLTVYNSDGEGSNVTQFIEVAPITQPTAGFTFSPAADNWPCTLCTDLNSWQARRVRIAARDAGLKPTLCPPSS